MRRGLDLALEDARAAGGAGRRVRLVFRDDATNPDVGLEAARELIREAKVRAIVGAVTSPVARRVAPLCEASKVVLISTSASAPELTQAGEFVFRTYPSDVLEGASMADLAKDIGLKRVAVVAVRNEFGDGLARVFSERFAGGGRELIGEARFGEGSTTEIRAAVAALKSREPDGVYVVAYAADVAETVRAARTAGLRTLFFSTSAVSAEALRAAGPAADGLVFAGGAFDAASDEPAAAEFAARYRARFGEAPDRFAAHAYDALRVLVLAMDRAGTSDPEAVRRELLRIDDYEGAAGKLAFDSNGDVVQYPRIFVVREGEPIPYDRYVEQEGALAPHGRR